MTKLSELSKFHGRIQNYQRFFIIATDNGYDFSTSDYINTSTSDYMFYLCWTRGPSGTPRFYFSADPDYMSAHSRECHYGIAWFKKLSNNKVVHVSDTTEQPDMTIELVNNALGDLFVGTAYTIGGSPPIYFAKHFSPSTDRLQRLQRNMILDQEYIIPFNVCYEGSTALTSSATYLDTNDYVTSDSLASLMATGTGKYQGCITNSDGRAFESILVHLIDGESGKILIERGRGETSAVAWTGTHYVYIFNRTSDTNYDNINSVSGLKSGIDIYLMTEPSSTYPKSFYNLEIAYHPNEYSRQVEYYSTETGKLTNSYPEYGPSYLFLTNNKPNTFTTETLYGGKLTLKGIDEQYTDHCFTTSYEANQGVIYRYCGKNETCGPCMTGVETCIVKGNGYQEVADGNDPMTTEVENKDWNTDNEVWNKQVPTIWSYVSYALLGVFMLTYVIWFGVFANELSTVTNIDQFHDWKKEYRGTIKAAIGDGVMIGIVFLATIGLVLVSAFAGKDRSIFPFVKYDRSVFNPPPGYVFEGSPTEKNPE